MVPYSDRQLNSKKNKAGVYGSTLGIRTLKGGDKIQVSTVAKSGWKNQTSGH